MALRAPRFGLQCGDENLSTVSQQNLSVVGTHAFAVDARVSEILVQNHIDNEA